MTLQSGLKHENACASVRCWSKERAILTEAAVACAALGRAKGDGADARAKMLVEQGHQSSRRWWCRRWAPADWDIPVHISATVLIDPTLTQADRRRRSVAA